MRYIYIYIYIYIYTNHVVRGEYSDGFGIRERRVVKVQEKESVLKECHEEEIAKQNNECVNLSFTSAEDEEWLCLSLGDEYIK